MRRDVYSGTLKLFGGDNRDTLIEVTNYTTLLIDLKRFEEASSLLRKTIPVARRVLGESDALTLRMRWVCARALSEDPAATLDDLREAVNTLGETEQTARRVLGGANPLAVNIERALRYSREALSDRDASSISDAFAAMTPPG